MDAATTERVRHWLELHERAEEEDACDNPDCAEELRMQAADIEHGLAESGFDVHDLAERLTTNG